MQNLKLAKLEKLILENELDVVALIPSPNFFWLTGQHKHLMERPTTLIIAPGKKPALVIAGFEVGSLTKADIPMDAFPFDDDPAHWTDAFRAAGEALGLRSSRIGVESIHFRFLETQFLRQAVPGCEVVAADALFSRLRLMKSDEEIACMRQAALIAQGALEETLKIVKPGVTEREIAAELVLQMLRLGSDSNLAFDPIVAGGPNSADPHAAVSDRPLQKGDFLLFDWGARYRGYCSDITRTFGIGELSDEQKKIHRTVVAANRAAVDAARPGVACGSIDAAARKVITDAGYGEYFTHRLGHGLGLEAHEPPYMFGRNEQLLQPGMVFTDEPGIYIPGEGGVRIEDDIAVTADGQMNITDFPRELRIL